MIRLTMSCLALLLSSQASVAQVAPAAPQAGPGAAPDLFPAPDRPVAEIVAPQFWNEADRDRIGEAERVRDLMGFGPGDVVADIGAGSGYHTVRLAPALAPDGRVVAQDVMPAYLEQLRQRLDAEGLDNVDLVLGDFHDPRIADGTLDGAILVHMYHEIGQPYAFLYNLVPDFAEGARVGIVDADRPVERHGTPPALLECEMGQVGYALVGTHDLGQTGYLAIYAPPTVEARPEPSAMTACQE